MHAVPTSFGNGGKTFSQQQPLLSQQGKRSPSSAIPFMATTTMTQSVDTINHDTSQSLIHKSSSPSSSSSLSPSAGLQHQTDASMFASFFLQLCAFPHLTTWTCQRSHLPSQICHLTRFLRRMFASASIPSPVASCPWPSSSFPSCHFPFHSHSHRSPQLLIYFRLRTSAPTHTRDPAHTDQQLFQVGQAGLPSPPLDRPM